MPVLVLMTSIVAESTTLRCESVTRPVRDAVVDCAMTSDGKQAATSRVRSNWHVSLLIRSEALCCTTPPTANEGAAISQYFASFEINDERQTGSNQYIYTTVPRNVYQPTGITFW